MERFTMRITDNVYYTKGKYEQTIPAECESWDVREILKRLADYEDTGLEPGEIKQTATLKTLNKQQWLSTEKEKPQTYIYDRLWLTIQYPSGICRTIEGRYNRYEDVFLHVNQKPLKEKVVAWKEYGVPSPFQPVVQ